MTPIYLNDESVFMAGWLLAVLATFYLAKWTTKGLLIYIATIAVILFLINLVRSTLMMVPC